MFASYQILTRFALGLVKEHEDMAMQERRIIQSAVLKLATADHCLQLDYQFQEIGDGSPSERSRMLEVSLRDYRKVQDPQYRCFSVGTWLC